MAKLQQDTEHWSGKAGKIRDLIKAQSERELESLLDIDIPDISGTLNAS